MLDPPVTDLRCGFDVQCSMFEARLRRALEAGVQQTGSPKVYRAGSIPAYPQIGKSFSLNCL